jgi:hypothetical protein
MIEKVYYESIIINILIIYNNQIEIVTYDLHLMVLYYNLPIFIRITVR